MLRSVQSYISKIYQETAALVLAKIVRDFPKPGTNSYSKYHPWCDVFECPLFQPQSKRAASHQM